MTVKFVPGQNGPLPVPVLLFRARCQTPFDLSVLVADANLRALTSEHFVFYNQPSAAGVQLGSDGIRVDLDQVHPDAAAVLCVASVDPASASTDGFGAQGLVVSVSDDSGTPMAEFEVAARASESAVICWELYRRGDAWKIRAVGQGYGGGLAELLTVHGVEVDDAPNTAVPVAAPSAATPNVVEPLDPERALERAWMIFEDAARSAAAFVSSSEYALSRLDDDLTLAVSDPSTRNTADGESVRAAAQKRHDDLLALARENHERDSAQLTHELQVIDSAMPRSMASWGSTAWHADVAAPERLSDGLRLGELTAADRGDLAVPYCVPLPLRRPLWVDSASPGAAVGVVTAVTARVLSAGPMPLLDVVDLTGALAPLTERVASTLAGPVIRAYADISTRLAALAKTVDLGELHHLSGVSAGPSTLRLLVLSDFPHGYSADDAAVIGFLAEHGHAIGLSIVIVGDDDGSSGAEESVAHVADGCQHLAVAGPSEVHDPWTGSRWSFVADTLDPAALDGMLPSYRRE